MKIKCLFQKKSTYQEVKDRAKHKPIKQKIPAKKGKTEKSKGYDEKKYLLGSEGQAQKKMLIKRKNTSQEVKDNGRNENQMPV